ncbi:helix-turn-helix transcriptional regulator [Nitratireductor sp. ac15]
MADMVINIPAADWSSPYVSSVTRTVFDLQGTTLMQPDGCWDFVVIKRGASAKMLRTGLTTRAVEFSHAPGDEVLALAFPPGTFMPLMPGEIMRDEGVMLEAVGSNRFRVGTEIMEIPRLDTADVFVDRLVRSGLVEINPIVRAVASGRPPAMSERTLQRHFLKTTGLTYKSFTQVERAQKAVSLLRQGQTAAEVAFALGYADQPHLVRSLKSIMGQTPKAIAAKARC